MTEARLATSVLAGALMRKAQGEGGFAAVLAKGDPERGAMLLILTERGANPRLMERLLQPNGNYCWAQPIDKEDEVPAFVARRRRFDPDLWLIELDVPSIERFTAEMTAFD
jgi:hypothetical protein